MLQTLSVMLPVHYDNIILYVCSLFTERFTHTISQYDQMVIHLYIRYLIWWCVNLSEVTKVSYSCFVQLLFYNPQPVDMWSHNNTSQTENKWSFLPASVIHMCGEVCSSGLSVTLLTVFTAVQRQQSSVPSLVSYSSDVTHCQATIMHVRLASARLFK